MGQADHNLMHVFVRTVDTKYTAKQFKGETTNELLWENSCVKVYAPACVPQLDRMLAVTLRISIGLQAPLECHSHQAVSHLTTFRTIFYIVLWTRGKSRPQPCSAQQKKN